MYRPEGALSKYTLNGHAQGGVCHFTKTLNLSIQSSVFPDSFKIAKLIALFKKGSRTEPKNYRPISLLPLFSKIFEKVVNLQTENFLMTRNSYTKTSLALGLNTLLQLVLLI